MTTCHFQCPFLGIALYTFCRNHHGILPQLWRGCKCLIAKTTSSLVWSWGCRHFVDAMTLSTVKTVTKMIQEKKMCAHWMVVVFFPHQEYWMNINCGTMTRNQWSTSILLLWLPITNELNWSVVKCTELKWI